MPQALDISSFIRKRLKYSAAKRYVASLSANVIHNLWHTLNETEISGCAYTIHSGRITVDILRAAFLQEMSYNPLRFGNVSLDNTIAAYPPEVNKIVKSIQNILTGFEYLWPNGVEGVISVSDVADPHYLFLRDVRDCFKCIARLNMADFRKADYRDEIIAYFASATDIPMCDDMRAALNRAASSSIVRRRNIRETKELIRRISAIEIQMKLHRGHDREFYEELSAERDSLRTRLDSLRTQTPQKKATSSASNQNSSAKKTMAPSEQKIQSAPSLPAAVPLMDEEAEITDAVEREIELLGTMTPEHDMNELFRDYIEQMILYRLHNFNTHKR